jgi:hypothetical protein
MLKFMLPLARVERGLHTYTEKNTSPKADPTEGMAGEEGMSFSKGIQTYGLFWILSSIVILRQNMEKTAARIEAQALMDRIA